MPEKVAVIGSGMAGLSAALTLQDSGASVRVYEASSRVGGRLHSEDFEGDWAEWGPQSLMSSHPEFAYWVKKLNLEKKIRQASPVSRNRYVFKNGCPQAIPLSPLKAMTSPLLGVGALLRILMEPSIKRRDQCNSVHDFFLARFGKKVVQNFVDPFVSGIHSGDSRRLSAKHAFSLPWEWMEAHGSILKGLWQARRQPKKSPYKGLVSFEGGMKTLVENMSEELIHPVEVNTPLESFVETSLGLTLNFSKGKTENVDKLVLALPSQALAQLVRGKDISLYSVLRQQPLPPLAVVQVLFPPGHSSKRVQGFGVLMSRFELVGRVIGILMVTDVFPRQDGRELMTVFIGGRRFPEVRDWDEEKLIQEALLGIEKVCGAKPNDVQCRVKLHKQGLPQYENQHSQVIKHRDRFHREHKSIRLVGNWSGGISVLEVARHSRQVMEEWLNSIF